MGRAKLVLDDMYIGDELTITLASNNKQTGASMLPTTGTTFLVTDPDRPTTGTADSGSVSTLVDDARTEAEDFWNGCIIEITDASNSKHYRTEVTDFANATGTITFPALPITVAAGDLYRLPEYPVLTQQAASTSGNEGSIQLTSSNALGYEGRRRLKYHADFGTDSEDVLAEFEVKGGEE